MDKDTANLFPEFAVGDPEASSGAGAVYLFNLGGIVPPASATDSVVNVACTATPKFGSALACAGAIDSAAGADLDGDGLADLLVGSASNKALEIDGVLPLTGLSSCNPQYTFTGSLDAVSFGSVVMLANDFNGDGFVDIVIGDPGANTGAGVIHIYY
jgi:hypothetical protein